MWGNCWIASASGNQKGLEKDVDEEGESQRLQQALGGIGCGGRRGFLFQCSGGRVQGGITMRGGRSSWIDMRESSCSTTGKFVQ